jgi:multipile epidermal growth factor-like domains protein 8
MVALSGSMLVMLYSDTNYVLDGFRAEFSVTNCLNNCSSHGSCQNHSCSCSDDFTGPDCSIKRCDCGEDEQRGSCYNDRCECLNNFSGQSCSLHKTNPPPSQWHWMTNSSNSFSRRAAHSAVYHAATDSVYIFGGYDLNKVLANLEIFRFNSSTWENEDGEVVETRTDLESEQASTIDELLLKENTSNKIESGSHLDTLLDQPLPSEEAIRTQPQARYSHAACSFADAFLIYGGKLDDGMLSNELWLYNITQSRWLLRASKSLLTPPPLARHTLTFVPSNSFVYLLGGALSNGEFSSR